MEKHMKHKSYLNSICSLTIIFVQLLSTSCMGKAKNSYNSESNISYSNDFIQYAEDLTEYATDLTEYTENLTNYAEDLTEYANDLAYQYFGEYTDGIYSVQLQSQEYIKTYLEINGVHTIDIEKIIAQLCVGVGTIIITAVILPALPVITGVSATTGSVTQVCIIASNIFKEAVAAAALDAAFSGTKKYYETDRDIEQTFYSAVEHAADGFMWGAVISSGMETVKEVKFVHQSVKEKKAVAEAFKCEINTSNTYLSEKSIDQIIKDNTDDLIKVLKQVPEDKKELVYRFFATYPDDAANLYAKYQDDILNIFEKIGKNNEDKLLKILKSQDCDNFIVLLNKLQSQNWEKALDILSKASVQNQKLIYKIFTQYGDDALELYTKYQDNLLVLYEKLGDNVEYQNWLIKSLKQNGDDVITLFDKNGQKIITIFNKYRDDLLICLERCGKTNASDAIELIEKFGDDVIDILKNSNSNSFKGIKYILDNHGTVGLKHLKENQRCAIWLYNKYQDKTAEIIENVGFPPKYWENRPSYALGQRDAVWNKASSNGKKTVRDPNTGKILKYDEPWDMGHRTGQEYDKLRDMYYRGEISEEEFLAEYRNPDNYYPEDPASNRSHKFEEKH